MYENIKFLNKMPKKNFLELKLTKIKTRPVANPETGQNEQNKQKNWFKICSINFKNSNKLCISKKNRINVSKN